MLVHCRLPLLQVGVDEAGQVGVGEDLVLAALEGVQELLRLRGAPDEGEGDVVEELGGGLGGFGELDLGGAEELGAFWESFAGEGYDKVGHFEG